jgi:hypothetical protein
MRWPHRKRRWPTKCRFSEFLEPFVTVPDVLLGKTKELHKYLELGFEYAKSLKAKPSRKKS